jgi:hypothetical protein
MLESTSEPASEPSKTSSTNSAEPSPIIKVPEEPTIEHTDTQTPNPNLDKTIISFKQDTKTPPPEYLYPGEEGISHPFRPDLEALLFGTEHELIDPTPTSSRPQEQPGSEVQALTFINENGKVVNVIAEGEESNWPTSRVGMAHGEICPVCLSVLKKKGKGEVEGDRDGDGESMDPKQCSARGGDMGERRVCLVCGEERVQCL